MLLALALLALSLTYRVQNGVRLVLPLVGLGVVGVSASIVQAWRGVVPGWRKAVLLTVPAIAVGWAAWAALAVWPDGLRYTNEMWGGTERGYLCLNDSNYDWGQGLKQLARWQRRRGLETLCVWRFGNDPLVARQRMRELQLEVLPIRDPEDLEALVGSPLPRRQSPLGPRLLRQPDGPVSCARGSLWPAPRPISFMISSWTDPRTAKQPVTDACGITDVLACLLRHCYSSV